MTSIQLLFTLGLGGAWLLLVFPLVVRDRDATVHGSAAGFERAMSVLRQDDVHRSTVLAPQEERTTPGVDNGGPVGRARPTSLRAASRGPISANVRLNRLRLAFAVSLVAVVATATAAVVWQGPFWTLFVIVTLLTGGFVAILRHRKLEADRAKAVIRSIRRDARSFVGREPAHAFEALPPLIASAADPRHYGGVAGGGGSSGVVEVH